LSVTDFFGIVLLADLASQGFQEFDHIGVVICGRIAALWSYGCDAFGRFVILQEVLIFHRTGIVRVPLRDGFPHCHRKTVFSTFSGIGAELAS
jgi:hypothetical protein